MKCVPDILKKERFSLMRNIFFTRNDFLSKETISFHMKWFLFTRNNFLSKEMFHMKQFLFMINIFFTGNDFHSQEMFSFHTKWKNFLSQEMNSFKGKLFPLITNDFLWQIIISFHRKLFPFRWHYFPHRKLSPFTCIISF